MKYLNKENMLLLGITILEIFTLSLMNMETPAWVIVILYGILGLGLRHMIKSKGMVSGNAIYDIFGIIGTTLIAIFYFNEKLKTTGWIGICLAVVALYMLNL